MQQKGQGTGRYPFPLWRCKAGLGPCGQGEDRRTAPEMRRFMPPPSTAPALKEKAEAEFYRLYEDMGMPGRGLFRAVRTARLYQSEALSQLELSFDPAAYRLGAHPGFLDGGGAARFPHARSTSHGALHDDVLKTSPSMRPVSPKHTYTLRNRILSVADDQARRFSASWSLHERRRRRFHCLRFCELVRIAGKPDLDLCRRRGSPGLETLLRFIAERLEASPEQIRRNVPLPELGMIR